MAASIAEIVNRACFDSVIRVNWCRGDRWGGHVKKTPEVVRKYLLDPQNESVLLDSGRGHDLTASMDFATGAVRWEGIPFHSRIVVPLVDSAALADAACDLARLLRALNGAMAVFPVYRWAEKFAYFNCPIDERAREMGLSAQRRREWDAWADHQLVGDAAIGGPEWGLFLGPGHLAKLSPATIRASNAFAEVRELGDGRAFLRLTDDPRDALAPDYESRLDRARDALRPILADPNPPS